MSLLADITTFVGQVFDEIVEFFTDLPVLILEGILGAIATVIEVIPMPDFMTSHSIASAIPSDIGWMLNQAGFPEAMTIVGSAFVFRFLRRVLTLGIW